MEDLKHLRDAIDSIDGKLLDLLNERARLAQEIGRIKERNGRPVYAPERAEQLMRRLAAANNGPLDEQAIRAIYREIMSASLALEKDTVIACEGCVAGRTHFAAKQQFGASVRYTFHADPDALFAEVSSGKADCGVIPFGDEGPEAAILELLAQGKVFLSSQIVLSGEEGGVHARYFVLGRTLNTPSGDDQTALLFHLTDQPGAIASALEPFKEAGVNVVSIHSRPARKGGLHLFLETGGHAEDDALRRALEALRKGGLAPVICGSYPRFH
jgi:chorismate mutase-like protein